MSEELSTLLQVFDGILHSHDALHECLFRQHGKNIYGLDNYFERFWCLVDEDKVKGTVSIARLDDITVELKALYLDSPLRGSRWGYKLLDNGEQMTFL